MLAADGRGKGARPSTLGTIATAHGLPLAALTSAWVDEVGAHLAGEGRAAVGAPVSVSGLQVGSEGVGA